jgi:HD-like signal output (HDOD) protein
MAQSAQHVVMRSVFAHIAQTCDLPPLPAVAARALTLARDPGTKADELARLVMTDAALAARVLKISQSVVYARRHPPQTLQQAIMQVGFQALRKILIAASARSAYRADDAIAEALWQHALATALAADELAVVAGEPRGGNGFVAGLLHDVGKLLFHLADAATFSRLGHADAASEEERYGATHPAVGGCLAERWGLEDEVVIAIMFHHEPETSPLAARLAIADGIAHQLGFGSVPAQVEGFAPDDDSGTALAPVVERVATAFEAERTLFD